MAYFRFFLTHPRVLDRAALRALLKAGVGFAVIVPACAVLGVVAVGISLLARRRLLANSRS